MIISQVSYRTNGPLVTLSFIDQFQKPKNFYLTSSIGKNTCIFQCKFSYFLNFKKKNVSFNLCATQVVRGENGKCYNFVIY